MKTQREAAIGQDRGGNAQIDSLTGYRTYQPLVKDWGPWGDPWLGEFDEPSAVAA